MTKLELAGRAKTCGSTAHSPQGAHLEDRVRRSMMQRKHGKQPATAILPTALPAI
jgi:hypothetical protein